MDINIIDLMSNYINFTIMIICLVVGYNLKNNTETDNVLIPRIVTVLGIVLAIVDAITNKKPIDINLIGVGAVSGLASTGFHQLLKTSLKKG